MTASASPRYLTEILDERQRRREAIQRLGQQWVSVPGSGAQEPALTRKDLTGGALTALDPIIADGSEYTYHLDIPSGYTSIEIHIHARSASSAPGSKLSMVTLSTNDGSATTDNHEAHVQNSTDILIPVQGGTGLRLGEIPSANADADHFGQIVATMVGYDSSVGYKHVTSQWGLTTGTASGDDMFVGGWAGTVRDTSPITGIDIATLSAFVAGSVISVYMRK